MSVPFGPGVLTLDDIPHPLRWTLEQFTDPRQGKNTRYPVGDAGLSAFSVFFMPSPSFLEYPRSLEQAHGTSNAQTLCGVPQIPSDNHIRHRLEAPPPSPVTPLVADLFAALNQAGVIDRYRAVNPTLLLAFAGTEYFSSHALHGPQCSTRHHANGTVTYSPPALTPVLVKPGLDKVLPWAPALVRPQDGAEQQDCELNAAQRGLADPGDRYSPLGITVLGDDLYCHEPFCHELLQQGMDFIRVCQPASHCHGYAWLDLLDRGGAVRTVVRRRWTGQRREIDPYRYAASLPLRDGDEALLVNWGELTTPDESGKVLYHNTFATSRPLDDQRVVKVVEAGRSRWKLDNENHTPLKTQGYHFEHNYGHGQHHLAALLARLILLAFLVHTVLEGRDDPYPLLRQKLPSRHRLFSDIRTLTSSLCFESWGDLMTFMLQSFEPAPTPLEPG